MYYLVQDVALTGIQTHITDDRGPRPTALKVAIVVCLDPVYAAGAGSRGRWAFDLEFR